MEHRVTFPSDDESDRQYAVEAPHPPARVQFPPWLPRLSLFLFLATCASTFLTTARPVWMNAAERGLPIPVMKGVWDGLAYSGPLMAILLCHELGHYFQARRYGVAATPPLFIPMPLISPFGTMGALIVQAAGQANRKALFDIAISGPLAGLVLAIPVCWWGVLRSTTFATADIPPDENMMIFGDPLILQWMYDLVHGPRPPGHEVLLNPLLFAGWVGILVTALNLMPLGQFDGGHILYTLIGRRAHTVALIFVSIVIGYMILANYWAFSLMIALVLLFGIRHPPTADDSVPLGWPRVILGWLTLAFFFVGMTPRPIEQFEATNPAAAPIERELVTEYDVARRLLATTLSPVDEASKIRAFGSSVAAGPHAMFVFDAMECPHVSSFAD